MTSDFEEIGEMPKSERDSSKKPAAAKHSDLSDYTYIPETNRKIEELKLYALASELSIEGLEAAVGEHSSKEFIRSFAEKRRRRKNQTEKLLAFATLGQLLDDEDGDWGCLPPHSRWWKLFRELFLECSQYEIAGEFQSSLSNPKTARLAEFTDPVPRSKAKRGQKKLFLCGGVFSGKEDYEVTRRLSRIRIRNYDILSVDSIRGELITKRTVRTESDWGAILDILGAIDSDLFPDTLILPPQRSMPPREGEERNLLEFLIAAENEGKGMPRIPGFYEEAALSLRKFLFNAAIEECTRSIASDLDVGPSSLESVEREFTITQVLRNPGVTKENPRLADFFAYLLEEGGSDFVGRLMSPARTIEKGEQQQLKRRNLVPVLARYWINPNYPLFLMRPEGVQEFLGALCFDEGEFDGSYGSALDQLLRKGKDETCLSLFRVTNAMIEEIAFDMSHWKLNSLKFSKDLRDGAIARKALIYFSDSNRIPKLESPGWSSRPEKK